MTTIPNGDAAQHVVADGHYLMAGITLLRERPYAEWYFSERFSDGVYDVGNYHSWDAYRSWFIEAGLDIVEVEDLYSSEDPLDAQVATARDAVSEVIADTGLPAELRDQIAAGLRGYEARVDATLQMSEPERRRRIEAVSWRVFATKGRRRRRFRWYGPSAPAPECWRELGRRVPGLAPLYRLLRGRR
jgi:hypothetical protein